MLNIKEKLLNKTNNKCSYCGIEIDFKSSVIDHIIPLSKGGTNDEENLTISCKKCNILKADKILDNIGTPPLIKTAAKLWIHSFLIKPTLTIVLSVIALIITIFSFYSELNKKDYIYKQSDSTRNFNKQFSELTNTENSLKELLVFISTQKNKMLEVENILNELNTEKKRLEPLVKADKESIKALLEYQNNKSNESNNKERIIGFGLGVLGSIIAAIIIAISKYFYYKRKEN